VQRQNRSTKLHETARRDFCTANLRISLSLAIYHLPLTIYYSSVDQSQHELLVGLEELVEQTALDLGELREVKGDGRAQRKLIDAIFRRVHTVKGSAATFGLTSVSQVAHEFENLLVAARDGRVELDDEVLGLCETATDALSETLSLAASEALDAPRTDLFEKLQAAASRKRRISTTDPEELPSQVWEGLNETEKRRLTTILDEGTPLFALTASFDLADFDKEFARLQDRLSSTGEIISTSPAVDPDNQGKITFRLIYATNPDQNFDEFPGLQFEPLLNVDRRGDLTWSANSSAPVASVSSQSNFVRADLETLDRLISSTHELFRTTSNTLDLALSHELLPVSARHELTKLSEEIRRSFLGVEDELINLRMVELGPTLQRAARAGRAATRAASKDIQFEIAGSELRLDKMLADAIADPLIHLVRNAVDHGIESAETRVSAGKSERGLIRIEGVRLDSQTIIRVTDDGGGIDPVAISEAAARLGIAEPDCRLDFERSLRLIFRPGFTTVAAASDVSGRGVGLDIVETSVEQVGGQLRISSRAGAGTTFENRLPVTFGLVAATVVVSDGNRYCIESSHVVERADSRVAAKVTLRELLGQPPAEVSSDTAINYEYSVNGDPSRRVQIVVDDIEGKQEVLVRNLGRHGGRWTGVVGATELRDGSVALVLDLPRLLAREYPNK
jgi:two-component system chemotaxis sensor kinase CheA